MNYIFVCVLFLASLNVKAGEIAKVFGEGVFGTKWGASIAEVKKAFPESKIETYEGITHIVIEDGRTVLGVSRNKKDLIRFGFDTESRLIAAVVYFDSDDYGNVLTKLQTHFGQPVQSQPGSFVTVQWPEDGSTLIMLALIPSVFSNETALTISYTGLDTPEVSKKQLGF
jgi:hypothetical protein